MDIFLRAYSVADPGFPVGGAPTRVLFGENVCENERIGSHWRGRAGRGPQLGSANDIYLYLYMLGTFSANRQDQ